MENRRHVMGAGRRAVVVVAALGSFLAVSLAGTALAQSASSSAAPSGSTEPIKFVEGTIADLNTVNPWKALTTQEYEAVRADGTHFVVSPADRHVDTEIENVIEMSTRYWVVEKTDESGETAEAADPRE